MHKIVYNYLDEKILSNSYVNFDPVIPQKTLLICTIIGTKKMKLDDNRMNLIKKKNDRSEIE